MADDDDMALLGRGAGAGVSGWREDGVRLDRQLRRRLGRRAVERAGQQVVEFGHRVTSEQRDAQGFFARQALDVLGGMLAKKQQASLWAVKLQVEPQVPAHELGLVGQADLLAI